MSFPDYMLAKLEKEKAYEQYNYASANLKLKQIFERLAELKSQHDPLAQKVYELSRADVSKSRDLLYSVAFYAVVGRWPA